MSEEGAKAEETCNSCGTCAEFYLQLCVLGNASYAIPFTVQTQLFH